MRGTWSATRGRLVLAGSFDDVTLHRHAVVQIAVGLDGHGIWVPPDNAALADDIATVAARDGLSAAADHLQDALLSFTDVGTGEIHPQLGEAIDVVDRRVPHPTDLHSVARAVSLSPDYLGRLFKRQTGVSFSATARWMRLLAGLDHLSRGASVTDAAHLAGFADGAHANRVCREFAGIAPSEVVRALEDNRPAT